MLRLVHHAVSALRSCIQLKRWGFEPSLSSCFSYTLSVIVAFLQLCASVSLYFAVKFSFPVCLILHHSTKGKQIPVALYAAPAGHHPPARRSVVPPPQPPPPLLHFPTLHVDLYILHTKEASPWLHFPAARLRHQTPGDSFIFNTPRWSRKIAPSIPLIKWWTGGRADQ